MPASSENTPGATPVTGGTTTSPSLLEEGRDHYLDFLLAVKGVSHFSVLAPINEMLARKVVADKGARCNITVP